MKPTAEEDKGCYNCIHQYRNGSRCNARPCMQGEKWEAYVAAVKSEPAEGAEEILFKHIPEAYLTDDDEDQTFIPHITDAMREFAALHAQKIADKMVSERMREELARFKQWDEEGNITESPDIVFIETVNSYMDEYLKSREK